MASMILWGLGVLVGLGIPQEDTGSELGRSYRLTTAGQMKAYTSEV